MAKTNAIEPAREAALFPKKRDLFAELENHTGQAAVWRPEIGDTIVGVLIERRQWDTDNGPADVAIIAQEDKDGEPITVFLNPTILWKRWQEECPRLYDRVGIKLCSKETSKTGREYSVYALLVDRNPANYPTIEEADGTCSLPIPDNDPFKE